MLKDHADSPQNHPVHRAIARIAGGAALDDAALCCKPHRQHAAYFAWSPGGVAGLCRWAVCRAANGINNGGVPPLDVLMTNLVGNIEGPIIAIVSIGAFVMGAFFIVRGFMVKGR